MEAKNVRGKGEKRGSRRRVWREARNVRVEAKPGEKGRRGGREKTKDKRRR